MERNRSGFDSTLSVELLRRKLNSLQPNFGVWRDNLVTFLGPALCAHLHLSIDTRSDGPQIDGTDELRAKVIWQLRRAVIEALSDETSRRAVAVALNITKFPELARMRNIEDRAKWCQEHHQWPSRKTIGNRMSLTHEDSVLTTLAQELCKPRLTPRSDEVKAIIAESREETIDAEPKLTSEPDSPESEPRRDETDEIQREPRLESDLRSEDEEPADEESAAQPPPPPSSSILDGGHEPPLEAPQTEELIRHSADGEQVSAESTLAPVGEPEGVSGFTATMVDDDAVALAMQRRMNRTDFIVKYQQRTGRDGRRARAELEAKFGLKVGRREMRIAAARARWTSPTAYTDFDLDTREGIRNMYRQMMDEAAWLVYSRELSAADVVRMMRANYQRPDISGHTAKDVLEQVSLSAVRMWQVLEDGTTNIQGRVIDEQGNIVEGVQQATGSSIRRNRDGQVVGHGANLISDSEVDAWIRGVLEYSEPAEIAAGTLDAVRVLAHYVRVRLERSVAWQKEAEQSAASEPNSVAAQQQLLLTERETKRQLAAADALRHAMRETSPAKVRCFAENVLWHDIDMAAAGFMNIEQLIERFRDDKEFKQYRRES